MNDRTAVFRLLPIVDDPRFEGFGTGGAPSVRGKRSLLEDFLPDGSTAWDAPILLPIWKPIKVVGRVRPFNDYPCLGMLVPAFSDRAVDALGDFLEANGELLPLISDVGAYYAYNITTIAAVLDARRTDALWSQDGSHALKIRRYAFKREFLSGLTIFRIPERSGDAYVSNLFVERAQSRRLRGLRFEKVWPLPAAHGGQKLRAGQVEPFKRESVFIRLRLASAEPSASERQLIDQIMDKIDALLVRPERELDSPAVGSLERHDFIDGICTLSLSCPDADALVDALRSWLKSLAWPAGMVVAEKRAEFFDDGAIEEQVSL